MCNFSYFVCVINNINKEYCVLHLCLDRIFFRKQKKTHIIVNKVSYNAETIAVVHLSLSNHILEIFGCLFSVELIIFMEHCKSGFVGRTNRNREKIQTYLNIRKSFNACSAVSPWMSSIEFLIAKLLRSRCFDSISSQRDLSIKALDL